jgi:DNA-binding IclR family transcriptional regulator
MVVARNAVRRLLSPLRNEGRTTRRQRTKRLNPAWRPARAGQMEAAQRSVLSSAVAKKAQSWPPSHSS